MSSSPLEAQLTSKPTPLFLGTALALTPEHVFCCGFGHAAGAVATHVDLQGGLEEVCGEGLCLW